jgi:uncharacterized membrane protein YphA (DoxX/SURF4 family)
MDGVVLAARLILAAVFLLAGAAKLANRPGSRQALVDFGVPAPLVGALATLLPVAELSVATMLVPTATARVGAAGALGILSGFVVAIGANLAAGRRPDCHCFGQLHSTPIGASTLGRNAALGASAGMVVAWGPGEAVSDAFRRMGDLSGVGIAALVMIVVLCLSVSVEGWVVINLLRQNGRLLLRVDALEGKGRVGPPAEGLPVGMVAPTFTLADATAKKCASPSCGVAAAWPCSSSSTPGAGRARRCIPRSAVGAKNTPSASPSG